MTPTLLVAVALAGGLGSVARFLVDGAITRRWGAQQPWGTFVVNVTGSFALGLVVGLAGRLGPGPVAVVGLGLLGGYTTFSTAMWEGVRLLRGRRWTPALLHTLGLLLACLLASAAGLGLGGL